MLRDCATICKVVTQSLLMRCIYGKQNSEEFFDWQSSDGSKISFFLSDFMKEFSKLQVK